MGTTTEAARRRAFRTHVEPEIQVLLRVAATLTGSAADAEDLVQETVIRAWKAIDRFDGAHPRAWLLTILRNTNANMHRKRRPVAMAEPAEEFRARPAFGAPVDRGPEELHVDGILGDELEQALLALDTPFRTVLLLVDVDGLSYAEAAQTLGVPLGTVMSRLSRARRRVREHLHVAGVDLMTERSR